MAGREAVLSGRDGKWIWDMVDQFLPHKKLNALNLVTKDRALSPQSAAMTPRYVSGRTPKRPLALGRPTAATGIPPCATGLEA